MGCSSSICCLQDPPVVKKGVLYSEIRSQLQPLDLLLFNGGDAISDLISYIERKQYPTHHGPINAGEFSHVGLVVTSDILTHELVKPGVIYILESTMSGKLGNDVNNIEGHAFFGVQLRNFDELLPRYDEPNDTAIAFAHLKYNPWVYGSPEIKRMINQRFTELFDRVNGIPYNANPYSLLSAVFSCMRPERAIIEDAFGTRKWLFCSELAALVYKTLGIYPAFVDIENIIPMDFIQDYEANGNSAPTIIQLPPTFITTPLHK